MSEYEDYENVVVDLYPNGERVSEAVFDAINRVMGNYCFNYLDVFQYPCYYARNVLMKTAGVFTYKTPTEILGKPLMDAIAEGYTPWFEGDPIPDGLFYFISHQGVTYFNGDKNINPYWQAEGPAKIIAYKKAPSIESKILAEKTGSKYDQGKPAYNLIPVHAEAEFVDVLTFGANKYGAENWRKVDNANERYLAAAMRHIAAYRMGETHDIESGKHHLAHAKCCLAFIIEMDLGEE